jgi:3-oxoacyl-[acyl-carrier protein] reductase
VRHHCRPRRTGRRIVPVVERPDRHLAPDSRVEASPTALAGEGGPHNILVNALLVGFIESDQRVRMAREAGLTMEQYAKDRSKDIPLGRTGRAEEFANIACFLASDAGSYVTGTAINVDGGRSPVV